MRWLWGLLGLLAIANCGDGTGTVISTAKDGHEYAKPFGAPNESFRHWEGCHHKAHLPLGEKTWEEANR